LMQVNGPWTEVRSGSRGDGMRSRRDGRSGHSTTCPRPTRLETAVSLGDFIEGDPLGHARPDGASCQQAEQLLEVLPEPGGDQMFAVGRRLGAAPASMLRIDLAL
jgi:hypothetical protein